jgi:RNA recognition motif-containing protein
LFNKFGTISQVDVNSEKGFAFVDFANADGVQVN